LDVGSARYVAEKTIMQHGKKKSQEENNSMEQFAFVHKGEINEQIGATGITYR
jgi:hypothetical protein